MERQSRILVVDDDQFALGSIARTLEYESYQVVTAAGGSEAIELLKQDSFDLVLTDLKMPKVDGLEVLRQARQITAQAVVLILTGYPSLESAIEALRKGAYDYLVKPCSRYELKLKIERGLERVRLVEERRQAQEALQRYAVRLKQRAEELASLNEASRVVTSSLDIPEVLTSIVALAGQVLRSVYSSVVLVKEDGTLSLSAEDFRDIPPLEARARPQGTTRRIIATSKPLVFNEVMDDGTHNRSLIAAGVKSYAGMPLIARGRTLGVLFVHSTEPRAFSGQLPLLTAFANQAAIAILNAHLFEQVHAGRERLQALSRRLVDVQEAERRHIALELHDEVSQLLTGLKLSLETGQRLPADEMAASLDEAQALVNELLVRVHELSLDLRPAMLDDLGLLPTLLWHFERYTAQTHVGVTFQHTELEGRRFAPEVETTAYRIVQEGLTNVARHAGVNEVTVRVWADQGVLGIQIEDQGAGFDPEAALTVGGSSGLTGMHERALLLGGHLTAESAPGTGTCLTAELPLGCEPLERRRLER